MVWQQPPSAQYWENEGAGDGLLRQQVEMMETDKFLVVWLKNKLDTSDNKQAVLSDEAEVISCMNQAVIFAVVCWGVASGLVVPTN